MNLSILVKTVTCIIIIIIQKINSNNIQIYNCSSEKLETICQNHELADYCELYDKCAEHGLFRRSESESKPVKITDYYESRCPYSIDFLVKHLVPAFIKLHHTGILHVDLIPYGAVKVVKNSMDEITYKCQHGKKECHGSKIHACALHLFEKRLSIPLIGCIASIGSTDASLQKCTKGTEIDPEKIIECASGEKGIELFKKMGRRTAELEPKFESLPWVLFNGEYSEKHYKESKKDVVKVICDMYRGEKPRECINHNS